MEIIFTLLVLALIAYIAFWIISQIGFPDPIGFLFKAIVGIVLLVALFTHSGLSLPFG